MEVKNIGHQDSVTMGTYDIEEIEKSNENKVDIIWKQSQQIEKLKDKLQKQAEWIENNKNKAKNCAMQMQNQGKEIQRLKQSNKDLMAVIWKTKRERANKGREVCKANNEIVQYKKRIAKLEEQLKNKPKFNVGDKVYLINKDEEVERDFIESIDIDTFGIEYYTVMHSICWYENELFSTKDEAEAKLKKLKV